MSSATDPPRPLLACLLPVRDGAAHLPAWFESVARFADVVVALDDGSTDDTRAILEAHPLVATVLDNPPRDSYAGWNDAENRGRLLEAAAALRPRWIMQLDADERIDAEDSAALRRLIQEEALAGFAYGFRVHRMIGDTDHYDRAELWAFRLFAFDEAARLPTEPLHLVPVPASIPRSRYLRTTIRIQHLAGVDAIARRARFHKYAEADPEGTHQASYEHLLDGPDSDLLPWLTRGADDPLLALVSDVSSGAVLAGPVLSAVVIAQNDEQRIEAVVRSVVDQECPVDFEVIVVTSGSDHTAEVVRRAFPDVTLVELPRPVLPGEARNIGLRYASGDYVSFPGSHVELAPGSLAARVRAHDAGWPMVTGTTLNGTDTPAGWANYFLDHSTVLPGRPSEALMGPPAHCSYMRHLLDDVGGFPEHLRAGEDTVVNRELFRRGHRAFRSRDVVLVHNTPCATARRLATHHLRRGRGYGRILLDDAWPGGHLLVDRERRRHLVGYLPQRLRMIDTNVTMWGGPLEPTYRRVRKLVVAGALAAWLGLWAELLRPEHAKRRRLVGTTGITLVVAGLDRRVGEIGGRADALLLVRLDLADAVIRILSLPRDLVVELEGHGHPKLNEVHDLGALEDGEPARGRELLGGAVARATGVEVDGVLTVDLEHFPRLVDGLHGLDLAVSDELDDPLDPEGMGLRSAKFRPGRQTLDGADALAFARSRRVGGEHNRRRRHLQLLTAAVDRVREVKSPAALLRMVTVARECTGASVSRRDWTALIANAPRLRRATIAADSLGPPIVASVREPDRWVDTADPQQLAATVSRFLFPQRDGCQPRERGARRNSPNVDAR